MEKVKQGVSLIVLVITIVVMIILASATIISLTSSGVISRANEAVAKYNTAEVQQLASLAWAEAYIDKTRGQDVDLEERVLEALEANKVNTDQYDVVVTDIGVSVTVKGAASEELKSSVREVTEDGVPIPVGFVKSPYDGEGTKAGGLVIYALTEAEIKAGVTDIVAIDGKNGTLTEEQAHYESLIKRNQFVWVPVDSNNFEKLFKRTAFTDEYPLSPTLGTNYWELILTANNMVSQDTEKDNIASYVSPTILQEATKMYESVKKYGGFYIARYEVGSKENFNDTSKGYIATRATKDNISNLSVTMQKYPYNRVSWGTSMKDETSEAGAVSLARAFYPSTGTTYGVVSTLTYGVQWDRTLAWWEEQDALDGKDDLNLRLSVAYGVYYDTTIGSADLNPGAEYSVYADGKFVAWNSISQKTTNGDWLLTTGGYEKANVYNIYDMAGNLYEWTMEGGFASNRVLRGGIFNGGGNGNPVGYRFAYDPGYPGSGYGFRPALYIK